MSEANKIQIAGTHYKQLKHETWDVIHDWGLGYFDGNAVKYLSRWRHKNGVEDLKKAMHYIQKLIEIEEAMKITITALAEKNAKMNAANAVNTMRNYTPREDGWGGLK